MTSLLFTILSIFLLILQMYSDRKRGQFNILNVVYLFQIYYIVQIPLSSCFSELSGLSQIDERVSAIVSSSTRLEMLLLAFLGHLFFVIGTYITYNYSIQERYSYCMWNRNRVGMLIVAFIVLGYVLFLDLMRSYGGISNFIAQIEYWRNKGLIGKGLYITGIARVMPISIVLYIIYYKNQIRANQNILRLLILVLICIIPVLILGFRSYIFNVLITMIAAYHYIVKPIKPRYFAFGIVAFAVFFSFYSLARSSGDFGIGTLQTVVQNFGHVFQKLLLRSRGSEIVSVAMNSIELGVGHLYSMDLITDPLVNLIPRSIWPNKPETLTTLFPNTFFGMYGITSGLSPTCIGELYWEWGHIGVCVGMMIIGIAMRLFQNSLYRSSMDDNHMLTYCVLVWPFTLLSETIAGALNMIIILLLVLFFVRMFLNVKLNR